MESEVHKLAKTMMLRDLRGYLKDWEEGLYTFLDIGQVMAYMNNIFTNCDKYIKAAKSELAKPKQLPLLPEEDLDQWIGEDIEDEIRRQG